ncbi:MAG: hypothetical protein JJU36_05225 [Phycisphaeraceae bacterium]|nr:hypothetical protein [Phycisphaeraceae bacterium]
MNETKRTIALLAIMIAALAGTSLWAGLNLAQARFSALSAQEETRRIKELEQTILSLRQRPAQVGIEQVADVELLTQLEASAQRAGLLPRQLDRIQPDSERRLGDSVYVAYPTRVSIRQASLGQTLTLMNDFIDHMPGFRVAGVRLGAPRGQETGSQWRVELVLEHLVYQPPTQRGIRP